MALLWMDGFDGLGTATNYKPQPNNIMSYKYAYENYEDQFDIEDARDWYKGLEVSYNYASNFRFDTSSTDLTRIVGIQFRPWTIGGYNNDFDEPLISFEDTVHTEAICVKFSQSGFHVSNFDDSICYGIIRHNIMRRSTYYVECKVYSHATNGTINLRINGIPVLDFTGNTIVGALGYTNRIRLCSTVGGRALRFALIDHLYIADGTAGNVDDMLGWVKIQPIFPDSDVTTNWAGGTGNANYATHYEQVNSGNALWATDYVKTINVSVSGIDEVYGVSNNCAAFDTIHAVSLDAAVVGHYAAQYGELTLTSGNTTVSGPSRYYITSTRQVVQDIWENNPDTSNAWTPATVNAVQIGIKVS